MVFAPITKVALYARVNTTDKGQDLEVQLHELRDYARGRKSKVVTEYVDAGVSGLEHSRPQLHEWMKAAHHRRN